jgi:hypothetical protein
MTIPTPSIRRSAIDRIPLSRRVFAPSPRRKLPRWARSLLLGLLVLLLLAAGLVSCHEHEKPTSLATSTLVGPRLVTGPICIEEAVDVSGSMDSFRAEREQAEGALFDFARRELTKDDLFSAAYFAGSAKIALPPSSLTTVTAAPGVPDGIDYVSTNLAPAVDALVDARSAGPPGRTCAARALVVITDGLIADSSTVGTSLSKGRYTRVFAVIPSATGWSRPSELTGPVLDSVAVYHFRDSGLTGRAASIFAGAMPLDVVFGTIIGSLTGQELAQAQ